MGKFSSLFDELVSFSNNDPITGGSIGLNNIREDEYEVALIDRGFGKKMPFVINSDISDVVKSVCNPALNKEMNSRMLFDWVVKNIRYGEKKRRDGYRNSAEVFVDREGVCGESSFLYITMIRSIGVRASFVNVNRDGSEPYHACAMLDLPGKYGHFTLADPANSLYDARHASFRPLTDFEIFGNLNAWNRL
ncbi:MAG: transglutaminase-like domain-containing protein [Nanoarchaeota archaeon]|nr:transglutaminase-like domain-containing protein [Nanoarchaeota archaeon]